MSPAAIVLVGSITAALLTIRPGWLSELLHPRRILSAKPSPGRLRTAISFLMPVGLMVALPALAPQQHPPDIRQAANPNNAVEKARLITPAPYPPPETPAPYPPPETPTPYPPPATPVPTPSPTVDCLVTTDPEYENGVVALINRARAREGLLPLVQDPQLTAAARRHSMDMACHGHLSHTGSDGSSPWDRINQAGYEWMAAAELIAAGQASPEQVVTDWLNSSPHHRLLMGDYHDIGVGYAYINAGFKHFWTVDLAKRK